MGEVNDVEQAKNQGQSKTQHRIEGAVDQSKQELAEQRLRRYSDQCKHQ
jgi:hypothetical protein